ncbi:hypothetical protein HAX54_051352 [Datura stramonium]|uniref:Uncharacterized protein n=1 Tax=Datura stramonium TaxID=4076 RepID=A0ABS8SZN7_DATST|nr:hypothetical protein [Datura stramonium]
MFLRRISNTIEVPRMLSFILSSQKIHIWLLQLEYAFGETNHSFVLINLIGFVKRLTNSNKWDFFKSNNLIESIKSATGIDAPDVPIEGLKHHGRSWKDCAHVQRAQFVGWCVYHLFF